MLNEEQIRSYRERGFCVAPALFSPHEVEATCAEITRIAAHYPGGKDGLVQLEPAVLRGEVQPVSVELGIRKLYRMALQSDWFRNLAFHPGMTAAVRELLGPDFFLLQSMLLMKPPRFGMVKVWHQDNAYFHVTPPDVLGFWVALEEADVENGCMHVVPGSHQAGLAPHDSRRGDHGLIVEPDPADVIAIPLHAGDALLFDGEVYHYTPDNLSDRRRRAVQYHYASTHCRQPDGSPAAGEMPVSGAENAPSG
jgi:phytanoyl-CoA hydroxylase